MNLTKCKLGELITQRREKNTEEDLPICGVSREGLIPPKQKDADTSIYNVFYRNDFIFNPARMELNAIAFNDKYDRAICSSLYEVFYVHRTDILAPEFLKLIVKQNWFTRYCEFLGQGSAREYCRFANISEIEIEFPELNIQNKIVHEYQVIIDRIELKKKINDNLSEVLKSYFCHLYNDISDESSKTMENICTLASSKRIFADDYVSEGIPFYRGKEITMKQTGEPITDPLYISKEYFDNLKSKYGAPQKGDILLTAVGTIGNSYLVRSEDFYFKDGNIIWLKGFKNSLNFYIYDFMQTEIFKRMLDGICIGSTQTALTIVSLSKLQIKIPAPDILAKYTLFSKTVRNQIEQNIEEIYHLHELQSVLLNTLSH